MVRLRKTDAHVVPKRGQTGLCPKDSEAVFVGQPWAAQGTRAKAELESSGCDVNPAPVCDLARLIRSVRSNSIQREQILFGLRGGNCIVGDEQEEEPHEEIAKAGDAAAAAEDKAKKADRDLEEAQADLSELESTCPLSVTTPCFTLTYMRGRSTPESRNAATSSLATEANINAPGASK